MLKRPIDLRSASFKRSNEVLDAVLKGNKAQGYCKPVPHKDALTEEDKVRLNSYFADVLEADDISRKVFAGITWKGLRGGEVFAKLKKKTDIEIRTGEDGNEFFVLNTDFLTKISKGGLSRVSRWTGRCYIFFSCALERSNGNFSLCLNSNLIS